MRSDIEHELADIFPGTSEMARIMRGHDWTQSTLGDPRLWPDALKIPLRMLLTSRFEMWLGWGPELNFFYNDAYIPTLGLKHPEMLARPFREVWAEVYDDVADQVDRVRAGEATWNKALLLLLERSGYPEETYHSFSYSPLFQQDGSVGGLLCIVTEETARVISERRLGTLRQLGINLATVTNEVSLQAAVGLAFSTNQRDFPFVALRLAAGGSTSWDGPFDKLNAAGLGRATAAGELVDLPPDTDWPAGDWDRPPTQALAIAIPEPGKKAAAGVLLLALNPYRKPGSDVFDVAQLAAGQIGAALDNMVALRNERRRADRIWSVSRDIIVVVDADGIFRSVSPSWTRILGHPVEDVIGRPFSDFMHPDDILPSNEALSKAMGDQELSDYVNRFRSVEGIYHDIAWHTTMEGGFVYAYGRDITERRQVEQALAESKEQFRHLVQGVTDYAIYMLDLDGHVSSWNEGARRIKGYEPEEIIGRHFSTFYREEDKAKGEPLRALETARSEGRFLAEGWRVRKNGEHFRASVVIDAIRDDHGRPIGFAKITRDITEREKAQRELEAAQEALFQSQKMEAIGQLTGGVAHDFNNLLMAIMSSLELLNKRLPLDPQSQRFLSNAMEGARRGATLTQRMLAFARRQELTVHSVDVAKLLADMSDLVQRSIGPQWPIKAAFPSDLPSVRADANQLEMALLNLVVNARDATPAGGAIEISATWETVAVGHAPTLASGEYIRLVVRDHGTGMDEATLRRATEPFFTTKGVGKGTGLGLPMVHGMAQQLGGAFEIDSKEGDGTSAILWLPVADSQAMPGPTVSGEVAATQDGHLTILVVDDDALILMNTVSLLEDLGHTAIEAHSGHEAVALFSGRQDFDLVITDQAMPGMTGIELIQALDCIRPSTPSILASGYGEGLEVPGRPIVRLGKPYDQVRLRQAVLQAVSKQSA